MKLLSIKNIVDFLQNEFKDVDDEMVEDLLLKPHCKTNEDINELKENFPYQHCQQILNN